MRRETTNVLLLLGKVAACALYLTGFFHCQVTSILRIDNGLKWPDKLKDNAGLLFCKEQGSNINYGFLDDNDKCNSGLQKNEINSKTAAHGCLEYDTEGTGNNLVKLPMIQTGVLRTNCIDCLDRTNVAQYAYGLASLGHQLHALGLIDDPKLDLDGSLSNELMQFYERMGDTLALQYGGSAAHNKVFSERRGQWKAATQSQEFLGYFKPEQDKVVIWEMDSDQHYFASKHNNSLGIETPRSIIKRSLSVGSILQQNKTHLSHCCINNGEFPKSVLFDKTHEARGARRLCDSTPEISAYQRDMAFSSELAFDASTLSNFVDLDRFSSSTNSCEEAYERSTAGSTVTILSTECCVNGFATDAIPSVKE
ncbi:hypothetical protein HPP92_018728, partial [Vanilla planifolia]